MSHVLTAAQYNYLQGFYTHCYCVHHEQVDADYAFWASQLDKQQIPWWVQNTVAVTAEDRSSIALYLRTHLAKHGITVH